MRRPRTACGRCSAGPARCTAWRPPPGPRQSPAPLARPSERSLPRRKPRDGRRLGRPSRLSPRVSSQPAKASPYPGCSPPAPPGFGTCSPRHCLTAWAPSCPPSRAARSAVNLSFSSLLPSGLFCYFPTFSLGYLPLFLFDFVGHIQVIHFLAGVFLQP